MFWRNLITVFVLFLFFSVFFSLFYTPSRIGTIMLGGKSFIVEVARTDLEREKGLSSHIPLGNDQGMFFIFPKPDRYGFWMKDMGFSIDIIWIDENFKIVHIENSVLPETYPKIFYPESQSLYVLEVYAGQASSLGLKIGDAVQFIKK